MEVQGKTSTKSSNLSKPSGKENCPPVAAILLQGDVMLHKMAGWPHWPVKITSVSGESIELFYFGTNESATVKNARSLSPYNEENKVKFGLGKKKTKKLREAIEEADVFLKEK